MTSALKHFVRTLLIVLLVLIGSTILVRFAPGYLSDVREMDPRYASVARTELTAEAARTTSIPHILATELTGWAHLNLGISRQYEVPVTTLIRPRLAITARLIVESIAAAWLIAIVAALCASLARQRSLLWQAPATILLAIPVAAMATLCLLADTGGPFLVLSLLLAARDFKFLDRLLHSAIRDPAILQARAQGLTTIRLLRAHLLPRLLPQLSALATLSIVTALSAIVPVEVLFNVPGIGQLAWSAAMSRDLPVLLAVTLLMALAVTLASLFPHSAQARTPEAQTA